MLYEIGYDHLKKAIDNEYSKATMAGRLPGLAITPPFFSQYKTGTSADSDIQDGAQQAEKRKGSEIGLGSGPHIRESARDSMKNKVYESTPRGWAHVGL